MLLYNHQVGMSIPAVYCRIAESVHGCGHVVHVSNHVMI